MIKTPWPSFPEPSGRRYLDSYTAKVHRALGLTGPGAAQTAARANPDRYFPAVPVSGISEFQVSGPTGPFYWSPGAMMTTDFPLVTADTAITTVNNCEPGWCIPVSASDIIARHFPGNLNFTFDTMRVTFGGTATNVSPGMTFSANVTFNTDVEPGLYNYQITGTLTRQSWIIYFFVPVYSASAVLLRPITFAMDMDVTVTAPALQPGQQLAFTGRLCSLQQQFVRDELRNAIPKLHVT